MPLMDDFAERYIHIPADLSEPEIVRYIRRQKAKENKEGLKKKDIPEDSEVDLEEDYIADNSLDVDF